MLAPKSWLNHFVDLSAVTDGDFAEAMTFAGNKVEAIHKKEGETVFEFEITSNRPDTLSIIGLAREAAAVLGKKLTLPQTPAIDWPDQPTPKFTVKEAKLCPSYTLVGFSGTTVKPSSKQIQKRLELAGFRPVNNIVDITNYLMLQTCQPIHAFDADKIEGGLTLREAKAGETITSLDHVTRKLFGGEIIIEDEKKIIDLAGLMGGLNSEVGNTTKNILLIVPIYDPVAIRKASKNLKLRSEASNRLEKKLDLTQCAAVASWVAAMIKEESGGAPSTKPLSVETDYSSLTIMLSAEKIKKVVGLAIKVDLSSLGIKAEGNNYQPPAWRRDLETEVDLIEEISRLYGYNRFPKTLPTGSIPVHSQALKPNWLRKIKSQVTALGYFETYSSTLISQSDANHLQVLHPMSKDFASMRISIAESLLSVLDFNLNNDQEVNLFELGTVFKINPKKEKLPLENQELGLISSTVDFRKLKGQLVSLGKSLNLDLMVNLAKNPQPDFHPSHQAEIGLKGKTIGWIAQTKDKRAWLAAINATALTESADNQLAYPVISSFPAMIEDLTVTLPPQTIVGPVIDAIFESHRLVTAVNLTKIYQHNFTFHLTYQSLTRQLSAKDVQPIRKTIIANLARRYKAELVGRL